MYISFDWENLQETSIYLLGFWSFLKLRVKEKANQKCCDR